MQHQTEAGMNSGIQILSTDTINSMDLPAIEERITTISKQFGFLVNVILTLGKVITTGNIELIGDVQVLLPRYIVVRYNDTNDSNIINHYINSAIIAGNVGPIKSVVRFTCMGIQY